MPLYEYQCRACGTRFERIQKFSDPPVEACAACGGPVEKLISSPAIQFKGSGWYVTDYARRPASAKGAEGGKDAAGDAGGKETGSGAKPAGGGGSDTAKPAAPASGTPASPAKPSTSGD